MNDTTDLPERTQKLLWAEDRLDSDSQDEEGFPAEPAREEPSRPQPLTSLLPAWRNMWLP
jgi:hypothetical protein